MEETALDSEIKNITDEERACLVMFIETLMPIRKKTRNINCCSNFCLMIIDKKRLYYLFTIL